MAPKQCKLPTASAITPELVASIKEGSLKKKDEAARQAAAEKILELVSSATVAEEPMLVELLGIAITLAGDNKSKGTREAADKAGGVLRTSTRPPDISRRIESARL
jgi:elongation factor 3